MHEPFLIPIQFEDALVVPEHLERAKFWRDLFTRCPEVFNEEDVRVVCATHQFFGMHPGEEVMFFVQIYDETFQAAHWFFRLSKDNLDRVKELSGKPIPASLLLLPL